jgi:molybdate transport system regulatory protein
VPRKQPGPRKKPKDPTLDGASGTAWRGRLRLWIDIGGLNALGPGKMRLLDAIAARKSLSDAAKQLRMSYRQAWKHLRFIEERTGLTVVEPRRGGRHGGGTDLTPEGKALLEAYRKFRDDVHEYVRTACERYFARWSHPAPGDPPSKHDA